MRVGAIVIEYRYRGFTEEAVRSVLSQTVRPSCVLLTTGDDRQYDFKDVVVRRLSTESEGERVADAVRACSDVDAYELIEDDEVWAADDVERALAWLSRGRVFYQSATRPPVFPFGGNVSNIVFTSGLDLTKVASYPTLVDVTLLLSAIEQGFTYVFDPTPTVTRRIHSRNVSIYSGRWALLRDSLLQRLPSDFPGGEARMLAEMYLKKDLGSMTPYQRAEVARLLSMPNA